MVSGSNQPRPGTVTELINRLLDRGYNQAAQPALQAIASSTSSGLIAQRLAELDAEAARLSESGQRLTPDNPVLRALLADLETTLAGDSTVMGSVAEPVQSTGSNAAGVVQRQLAIGGMTDSQLAQIGVRWNVPDPEAVARLIAYARSDGWSAQLAQYGPNILNTVLNQAIQGIAYGWSPLRTAREIRRTAQSLPAYVANNLLRTLQLTSYRDSTALHQNANRDIAQQVVRIAALDRRTCLSCISQHGDVIWDSESGGVVPRVDDHHSGRCTSVIIIKGSNRTIQSGEAWWDSLSPERQAQQNSLVQSPGKLEALRNGSATLRDFVHPYRDPVFGNMLRESSLKDALNRWSIPPANSGMIETPSGMIPRDTGQPGTTEAQLTAFLNTSQGPLAQTFRENSFGIVEENWVTGNWSVIPENVRSAAKYFVAESQNIQYGRDYILSLVQAEAAQNGITVDLNGAARLYNQQYGYQAQAIQTAAAIANVRLTDAQRRRLETAANGDYLSLVYTTQSSVAGSLANAGRRSTTSGSSANMTDGARRERRREFLDRLGRLDQ